MSTATSATSPSPYNASIPPQVSSFSYKASIPHDDSFASYLAVVRDNFAPSDRTIIRQPPRRNSLTRKLASADDDDGGAEIDIFAAEKYFSITSDARQPDAATTKPSPIPVDRGQPRAAVADLTKSRSLTWTVTGGSSCASSDTSRNSQSTVFRDRRRAFHLGGLGFWCSSCSRKHAVDVNNASCATASIGRNSSLVEQKQNASWSPASWRIEMASPGPWPWPESTDSAASTLPRRRVPPSLPVPLPNVLSNEEDAGSESSSDLFEIESVALSRAEGAGYEPSEASIAWSVVTASAANVSVVSDRIEENTGRMGGQARKRTGILLSGCSSHKAVEVVEQRAAGDRYEKGGLSAAEMESTISPVVARFHVDLETGSGSGRIVAGRSNGTSWLGGSARIIL